MIGTPYVAGLRVFPFKSLRPANVERATVLASGALRRDREFALFDDSGAFVNGKREARVHTLAVIYDDALTRATFTSAAAGTFEFAFDAPTAALERWLELHFEKRVSVRRDRDGGFPDDTRAPGPTIVSTATLAAVAGWFPGLDLASTRDRFRSNIELGGVPAFWEDRLFGEAEQVVAFDIGNVRIGGTNPCARCIVPARDADTGEELPAFAKVVAQRRAATLPAWAEPARFDHYYRIGVNTRIESDQSGKMVGRADTVTTGVRPHSSPLGAVRR